MKNLAKLSLCIFATLTAMIFPGKAQWTLSGSGATGTLSTPGNISVAGNINMGTTSTIHSPTELIFKSGLSYFNATPTGLGARAGTGTGVFSLTGSQNITGSLTVGGNINLGGTSVVQSSTELVLKSGSSYFNATPTGLGARAGTGTGVSS